MRLKFLLMLLVILGFSIGCNSTREVTMSNAKLKWILPTQRICKANGGKINNSTCVASWTNAKNICHASGGRLASFNELKKVVTNCTGIIKAYNNNKVNFVYQDCYKRKGFIPGNSWSSRSFDDGIENHLAWVVDFYDGYVGYHFKNNNFNVSCVRDGQ